MVVETGRVVGGRVLVLLEVVEVDGRDVLEVLLLEVLVLDVLLVVGGRVVVLLDVVEEVLVVGRIVDVVLDVVVVGGRVVVELVVGNGAVVVVVGTGAVINTVQLVSMAGVMALPAVSKRLRMVSPMGADICELATALKVTRATLTMPVGAVRLVVWKPEINVWQVRPVQIFLLLVGALENSALEPPATETTVTRVLS